MPCKIFISTSGAETYQWTNDLRNTIAEYCNLSVEEIYWYRGSQLGNEIEPEIVENARCASILLCVITNEYLTSPWCVREHLLFSGDPMGDLYAIPVLAYGLKDWPDSRNEAEANEFFAHKLEKLRTELLAQFPGVYDEVSEYAENRWLKWLRSTQFSDLRGNSTVHSDNISKTFYGYASLQRLIKQLGNDIRAAEEARERHRTDPERQAFRAAAGVAAFSLAADRYYDGGWGFSMADDFAVDEHGDELHRGRYDLNVVVLRALEVFLGEGKIRQEWKGALGEPILGRRPRRLVKDRLPSVARLLACMERSVGFDKVILNCCGDIAAELNADPPSKRWGLDSDDVDPSPHHIVLHEFAFRASSLLERDEFFAENLTGRNLTFQIITSKVRTLEPFVTKWLSSNNIFRDFIQSAQPAKPAAKTEIDSKNRLLRSILWCLLAGSENGSDLLSAELQKGRVYENWDRRLFDQFQNIAEEAVDKSIKDPASAGDTLVFTLVCAYTLHAVAKRNESIFKPQFDRLRTTVNRALNSPVAGELLLNMNSLGWAITILLARDILEESAPLDLRLDRLFLAAMWEKGRELRKLRVRALSESSVDDLKGEKLQSVVSEQIDKLLDENGPRLVVAGSDEDRVRKVRDLRQHMLSSSFWGRQPSPKPDQKEATLACLAGVLQVRSPSGRIDLESEGYSRLFLHPFSELTGMNVFDLMGVRRELGEKDTTLVEKMGAVVVEECYERFGNRFRPAAFKKRTDFITDKLKDTNWPRHLGFDDLLKLRTGAEGHRWVYRTALIRPEYGNRSEDEKTAEEKIEHTIAWRFVQVPEAVTALIDNGSTTSGPSQTEPTMRHAATS